MNRGMEDKMKRKVYRNGDDLYLVATGCDGCSPAVINKVFCHETGCPDAWRDSIKECSKCGCDFRPSERYQKTCDSCRTAEYEEIQAEFDANYAD